MRQGLKCKICDVDIHKKCKEFIGDRCGLDQTEKRGRLKLSFNFDKANSKLKVFVQEARNLVPMDPDGTSDPYVKIKIINENGENIQVAGLKNFGAEHVANEKSELERSDSSPVKFKTEIQKSTLNPDFNETFEISIKDTISFSRILFEVWDYDMWNPNDFMGSMSFGISELKLRDVSGWYQLLKRGC